MPDTEDENLDEFVETLAQLVGRAANESILRTRAERFLAPAPPRLSGGDRAARGLESRVEQLVVRAGGIPSTVVLIDDERPSYDTYVNALFSELFAAYRRSRRALVSAHMQFVGSSTIRTHPDWLVGAPASHDVETLVATMEEGFWEHAETAYIRLASFWDRVAQVLDFFFFKVRHFERDGFPAVVDRIHLNLVPVEEELGLLHCWQHLRRFKTSEREDGFGWLARRRNLIVHSLHLRPLREDEDDFFDSLHNHLDARLREKLRPGTMGQEVGRLHGQLQAVVDLVPAVLSLCEHRLSSVRS